MTTGMCYVRIHNNLADFGIPASFRCCCRCFCRRFVAPTATAAADVDWRRLSQMWRPAGRSAMW